MRSRSPSFCSSKTESEDEATCCQEGMQAGEVTRVCIEESDRSHERSHGSHGSHGPPCMVLWSPMVPSSPMHDPMVPWPPMHGPMVSHAWSHGPMVPHGRLSRVSD